MALSLPLQVDGHPKRYLGSYRRLKGSIDALNTHGFQARRARPSDQQLGQVREGKAEEGVDERIADEEEPWR
jgi:hypothetical protein